MDNMLRTYGRVDNEGKKQKTRIYVFELKSRMEKKIAQRRAR